MSSALPSDATLPTTSSPRPISAPPSILATTSSGQSPAPHASLSSASAFHFQSVTLTPPRSSQESLKDFFLKKLTPLLLNTRSKGDTSIRSKAVKRQYAESLTSEECFQRLQEEKNEKEGKVKEKKKGKGLAKGKGKKKKLILEDSDSDDGFDIDDEFRSKKK